MKTEEESDKNNIKTPVDVQMKTQICNRLFHLFTLQLLKIMWLIHIFDYVSSTRFKLKKKKKEEKRFKEGLWQDFYDQ